jgi:hypothetical protein
MAADLHGAAAVGTVFQVDNGFVSAYAKRR